MHRPTFVGGVGRGGEVFKISHVTDKKWPLFFNTDYLSGLIGLRILPCDSPHSASSRAEGPRPPPCTRKLQVLERQEFTQRSRKVTASAEKTSKKAVQADWGSDRSAILAVRGAVFWYRSSNCASPQTLLESMGRSRQFHQNRTPRLCDKEPGPRGPLLDHALKTQLCIVLLFSPARTVDRPNSLRHRVIREVALCSRGGFLIAHRRSARASDRRGSALRPLHTSMRRLGVHHVNVKVNVDASL